MKRDYTLFLKDILEAIGRIKRFMGATTFEAFAQDDLLTSAVVRQLEIIGEAAKNLPEELPVLRPRLEEIYQMESQYG